MHFAYWGMHGFYDLLEHWTATELSDDLGVTFRTGWSIKRRGSVSLEHWPRLIEAAKRKGIALDEAMLAEFWRASRKRAAKAGEAA